MMVPNFPLIFGAALVLNLCITFRSSDSWKTIVVDRSDAGEDAVVETEEELEKKKRWKAVLKKYLAVYLFATLSDWLQGPYVYALYDDYGYSQHDIAVLFVAGFGSSMVFGSFIGGMADWGGRRNFVVLYAVVYGASCVTKHFKSFHMLMLGRLLGGISYSLLFSVFEAWLIDTHTENGIKSYLSKSFGYAAYANSVIAIVAGLVAHHAASSNKMQPVVKDAFIYRGGFINPFDIALCGLIACGLLAMTLWQENYGDDNSSSKNSNDSKWYQGLKNGFITTVRSQDILLCGVISSLFEGSMYIFVFMWTPSLTAAAQADDALPFGLIFSTFMVCAMAGSSLFSIQIEIYKIERLAVWVLGVAAISMALVAATSDMTLKFIAMNLFELTIGMYFPIIGTMKSMIVPDSNRVAIYNLYRIPLNFIVLFSLLTDLTPTQSFGLNFVMLSTATVLQFVLMKRREMIGVSSSGDNVPSEKEQLDQTVALMETHDTELAI